MANRNFPSNKLYNMHVMPVEIDAQISIGASGAPQAVSLSNAPGIKAITRKAAGIYEIQLQDNYAKLLQLDVSFQAPVSGGAVTAGSFSVGVAYQIVTLGSTNYQLIGVPADVTPAVGVVFVATGIGAGTGTAKILSDSGISRVEQIGQLENSNNPVSNNGARIYIKCLSPSAALTMASYTPAGTNDSSTPPIFTGTPAVLTGTVALSQAPADPANGCVMRIRMLLNNSSVQ